MQDQKVGRRECGNLKRDHERSDQQGYSPKIAIELCISASTGQAGWQRAKVVFRIEWLINFVYKQTKGDAYGIRHIHDVNLEVHGCRYLSKINFKKAFNQIPVAEEDIHKTG